MTNDKYLDLHLHIYIMQYLSIIVKKAPIFYHVCNY